MSAPLADIVSALVTAADLIISPNAWSSLFLA